MTAQHHQHRLLRSVAFTIVILGLIALAIGGTAPEIAVSTVVSVLGLAIVFHLSLPGSDFFSIVFANSIGVYACLFAFLITANFPKVSGIQLAAGFILPLLGFLGGVLWHRQEIAKIVLKKYGATLTKSGGLFLWICPLIIICILTFAIPLAGMTAMSQGQMLLVAMGAIALVVFLASRDIAVFLLDTGLLFEDFFDNAAQLVKPAFAFLTCYSIVIIVFASIFTIIDRYSGSPNFVLSGAHRALTLADGLYLSVCTLTTVGFGDIAAHSSLARLLVSIETLCGILLLLFGLEAILTSGRRKHH